MVILLLLAGLSFPQKVRAAEKQAARVQAEAALVHGLVDAATEAGRPQALAPLRSHATELHEAVERLTLTVEQLKVAEVSPPSP